MLKFETRIIWKFGIFKLIKLGKLYKVSQFQAFLSINSRSKRAKNIKFDGENSQRENIKIQRIFIKTQFYDNAERWE